MQLFSPTSFWNKPLAPSQSFDPKSSDYVGDLSRQVKWGAWINTTSYSTPIYTVPADQPAVRVILDSSDTSGLQDAFNAVPIPPNAVPSAGSDGHLTVLQPSSDTLWEFWQLSKKDDGWHARWGGKMPGVSTNPGYFMNPWYWGATATSLPLVGGLITISELQRGHIDHALAMAIPQPRYHLFSWPAQRTDGTYFAPPAIPEGTRFRLDPNLDLTKLNMPPVTAMIARAAQQYGIVVRDTAGSVSFYAEDPTPTGTNPYPGFYGNQYPNNLLKSFPWSSLQALQTQIDTIPPTTTITSGPPAHSSSRQATFTYSSNEQVVAYSCTLDGGQASNDCGTSRTFYDLADGSHEFAVKARDNAGNKDAVGAVYDFSVDTTPPAITFDSAPSGTIASTSASIAWSSSEAATFECELDQQAWGACNAPTTLDQLSELPHEFSVRATDAVGNVSVPVSATWTVDVTPPTTVIVSPVPALTASRTMTIALAASEDGATFECTLDGSDLACDSQVRLNDLADGQHTFSARAVDAAGNQDPNGTSVTFEVDTSVPHTTIDAGPADYGSDPAPSFAFSADQPASFQCQLDQGPLASCVSPWSPGPLADGVHSVLVQATGRAGAPDPTPVTTTFTIDTTPPIITIDSAPPSVTNDNAAAVSFTSSEDGIDTECQLDGAAWHSCGSPWSVDSLGDGAHEVRVRGTDHAANTGPVSVAQWQVDTVAPVTTFSSVPPSLSSQVASSAVFSASEAGVVFDCVLDGSARPACASPFALDDLAEGTHTLSAHATDGAGNVGADAMTTWQVDTTPPAVALTGSPPAIVDKRVGVVSFSAFEQGVVFLCSLDGGTSSSCTSPATVTGLADGPHTLAVAGVDAVGNQSPPATASWLVDTIPPDTTLVVSPLALSNDPSPSVSFSATESGATFQCRIDTSPLTACSSPLGLGSLSEGKHAVQVVATDAAGNVDASPASASWTTDLTPPKTTLTGKPAATTTSRTATSFFTSNDKGSRFECKLDGGGWTACSSGYSYSYLTYASHTFRVRGIDAAGNVEQTGPSASWTVQH